MSDVVHDKADITLLAISATRLNAIKALEMLKQDGINCNLIHLFWLKPFAVTDEIKKAVVTSAHGAIVLDGDFPGGAMTSIAFDVSQATGSPVKVLGLEERSAGFAPQLDNLPPLPEKIREFVKNIIAKKSL
jgi:transketolase C-terminal domain/subunit